MADKAPWEMTDEEIEQEVANQQSITEQSLSAEDEDSAPYINEQHPKITTKDRLLVGNFATNPEAAYRYLRQKYPEDKLDIVLSPDGQIMVKEPKELNYRAVNPKFDYQGKGVMGALKDTFTTTGGLKELGKDILGSATDIGIDTAATIGAAGAGIAGGVATGGLGALPAAAGAGAGISALGEAAKQGIGQALGMEENMDTRAIGMRGAIGAASPILFGTGAAKSALTKGSAKVLKQALAKGQTQSAAKEAAEGLANSQRGLLGRAYDSFAGTFLPGTASIFSGLPTKNIKIQANNAKEIARIDKEGPLVVSGDIHKKMKSFIFKEKDQTYKGLMSSAENATAPVNIASTSKVFTDAIDEAKKAYAAVPNEVNKNHLDDLESAYSKFFKVEKADNAAAEVLSSGYDPVTMMPLPGGPPTADAMLPKDLPATEAIRLRKALGDSANLNSAKTGTLKGRLEGKTSDSKALLEVLRRANRTLGESIETTVPEIAEANARYSKILEAENLLKGPFKDAKATAKTLKNLNSETNDIIKPLVLEMDMAGDLGIQRASDLLETRKIFAKPSTAAVSRGGSMPTSRTIPAAIFGSGVGGGLGYYLGKSIGMPQLGLAVGATAGGITGSVSASPAAIKMYSRGAKGLDVPIGALRGIGLLPQYAGQQALQEATPSMWEDVSNMRKREQ